MTTLPADTVIICGGGAKPTDNAFVDVRAIDEEIFAFLKRREKRNLKRKGFEHAISTRANNRRSHFSSGIVEASTQRPA